MDDVSTQIGLEQNGTKRYQKNNMSNYFSQSPSHINTRPKYPYSNEAFIRSQNFKQEKRQRQYYNDLEIDTSYYNENHQVRFCMHIFYFSLIV